MEDADLAGDGWEQVGLFDEDEGRAVLAVTEPLAPELEQEEFEQGELEEAAELEEEASEPVEELDEDEEDDEGEVAEYEDEEDEEDEEEYEEEDDEEDAEAAELEEDDDEEEEYEEYEEEEEGEEEEEEEEAEYLIQPHEDENSEQEVEAPEPAVVGGEAGSLLFQAGNLIMEENRVAVSMIQRRFTLDFDQACELLDRLQEEGLIGPYVGGRNREILLSPEEWEEKAASLSA